MLRQSIGRPEQDVLADVLLLLDAGADPTGGRGEADWFPLYAAIDCRHLQVARLLLDRGANADARTRSGANAVYFAAQAAVATDDLSILTCMLDAGADVNAKMHGRSAIDGLMDFFRRYPRPIQRRIEKVAAYLRSRGCTTPHLDYLRTEEGRKAQKEVTSIAALLGPRASKSRGR